MTFFRYALCSNFFSTGTSCGLTFQTSTPCGKTFRSEKVYFLNVIYFLFFVPLFCFWPVSDEHFSLVSVVFLLKNAIFHYAFCKDFAKVLSILFYEFVVSIYWGLVWSTDVVFLWEASDCFSKYQTSIFHSEPQLSHLVKTILFLGLKYKTRFRVTKRF